MSTEYRRGIPGTAHVEAATRLGLLWRGSDEWLHRFRNQNGQIEVWYFEDPNETPDWEAPDFAIEDLDALVRNNTPHPRHLRACRHGGAATASGSRRAQGAYGGASGPACQRARDAKDRVYRGTNAL